MRDVGGRTADPGGHDDAGPSRSRSWDRVPTATPSVRAATDPDNAHGMGVGPAHPGSGGAGVGQSPPSSLPAMPFRLNDLGWSPVEVVVAPSSPIVVGPPPGAQARAGKVEANSRSSSVWAASMGRSS